MLPIKGKLAIKKYVFYIAYECGVDFQVSKLTKVTVYLHINYCLTQSKIFFIISTGYIFFHSKYVHF